MEAQSKPLDLATGDILLHKKGGKYFVEKLDVNSSEIIVVDGVKYPPGTNGLVYQSMEHGQSWWRPLFMFTEDRFRIVGNIYDV